MLTGIPLIPNFWGIAWISSIWIKVAVELVFKCDNPNVLHADLESELLKSVDPPLVRTAYKAQ